MPEICSVFSWQCVCLAYGWGIVDLRRCLLSESEMESGLYHVTLCSLSCDLFKTSQKNEISFSKPYLEREKKKDDNMQENVRPMEEGSDQKWQCGGRDGSNCNNSTCFKNCTFSNSRQVFSCCKAEGIQNQSFYLPCSITVFHIASSLVFGLSRNIPTFHLCKLLAKTFSLVKIIWIILLFFIAILDKISFAFAFLIYNVYPSKLIFIFSCDLIK